MVVAYVSLGLIGYLVYRLGSLWFDRPIGAVAALIVLTRAPFLSNGLRAYIDLPYIALVLGALVTRDPAPTSRLARPGSARPGGPAATRGLAVLLRLPGLPRADPARSADRRTASRVGPLERADTQNAGLIRPAFVRARGTLLASPTHWRPRRPCPGGPLLWALFDWITAGSPTYSFTGTRETVETLERQTGPVDLVLYGPRRLGEVLQWPGMVGAAGGVLIGLAFLRRSQPFTSYDESARPGARPSRSAPSPCSPAPAWRSSPATRCSPRRSSPSSPRFALLGWRLLEPGHPWRRAWQAFAAVVALMFVVWAPNQYDLLHRVDVDLTNQSEIESDLNDLAGSGAFEPLCLPISVPNHRAVPRLAFDLDVRPSAIVSSSEQRQPRRGYFLDPAEPLRRPQLHPRPQRPGPPRHRRSPPASAAVARNESWVLYRRC